LKALTIIKVVISGVVLVVLAYYLIMLGLEPLSDKHPDIHDALLPWVNVTILLLYVIGGFVAGALSKQYFIIVGLAAGLFSTLLVYQLFTNGGNVFEIVLDFILCVVLGGIGGGLSLLLFKSRAAKGL